MEIVYDGSDIERILTAVYSEPAALNEFHAIMVFCSARRTVSEVEQHMEKYCAGRSPTYPVKMMIGWLSEAGALEASKGGARGEFLFTTLPGRQAMRMISPEARLKRLGAKEPDCMPIYKAILEFCCQPRSMEEVLKEFSQHPNVRRTGRLPDYFAGALETAGGLVKREGLLVTTGDGRVFADITPKR